MIAIAITAWIQLFIVLILIKENLPYELECVLMGILVAVGLIPAAQSALADQEKEQV